MKRTLIALSLVSFLAPSAAARQDRPIPADTEIVATASGLKYSVLTPGDGKSKPKVGDVVRMHYTGWLPEGKKFDSSVDRGDPFLVEVGRGRVIKGWEEAILLMTKGEKIKVTLPPELAYGDRGFPPVIPAKATLIFEIEFLDFAWTFEPLAETGRQTTSTGITYQVLKTGEGKTPQAADFVSVRFAAWKPNGDLIRWSEDEQMKRRMSMSVSPNIRLANAETPFFQEALGLTPLGGITRMEVPASLCFPTRLPPGLPADTKVTWQFEVVDLFSAPSFSMPEASKLKTTPSGLQYEVIREGTGRQPKTSSNATVHYAGWLTSGKQFDSSFDRGQPASFGVTQVIKGWTEGLQLMKEGGIYKFVIPANLGYGASGAGADIPPNATLVFYVVLLGVAG